MNAAADPPPHVPHLTEADRRLMGARLKAARALTGLSMRQIAERLGVSKTSVVQWENGILPVARTRHRLARLLRQPERKIWAEEAARLDGLRQLVDS
jgi:transcriptional regulator with XRE-family HTH domain